MDKQNKILKFLVIILLIAVLGLMGYIINNKSGDNTLQNNKIQVNVKEDNAKEYVYEAEYTYNNKYHEINLDIYTERNTSEGLNIQYIAGNKILLKDLKVPYFNFNTADAKNVNIEIKELYEKWAKEFDYLSENENCGTIVLNYKTYYTEKTVSVIIVAGSQCTDVMYPDYYGYTFNLETGKLLSYDDVILLTKYDKTETLSKFQNEIKEYIIKNISVEAQKGWINADGSNGDSIEDSLKTLNNNIKDNSIVYFLDKNNNLNIISKIYIAAGHGYSMHLLVAE